MLDFSKTFLCQRSLHRKFSLTKLTCRRGHLSQPANGSITKVNVISEGRFNTLVQDCFKPAHTWAFSNSLRNSGERILCHSNSTNVLSTILPQKPACSRGRYDAYGCGKRLNDKSKQIHFSKQKHTRNRPGRKYQSPIHLIPIRKFTEGIDK